MNLESPWTSSQRCKLYWRKFRLKIPRRSLVLEIGSGGAPHFRSHVLCDKFPDVEGTARVGKLKIDRPFVFGDAEALPFADKTFDYIICFHVLEHLNNPEKCLNELMRVGKAGYIETPSEVTEKIQGWSCHKWFIRQEDEQLILTQKREPVFDPFLHVTFHSLAAEKNRAFLDFLFANRYLTTVKYEWKGEIHYQLNPVAENQKQPSGFEEPQVENLSTWDNLQPEKTDNRGFELDELIKACIDRSLRNIYSKTGLDLYSLLACPLCRSPLRCDQDSLLCPQCGLSFPKKNGVPVLLQELAQVV